MSFAILTDTTANLDPERLATHRVIAIPFPYFHSGEEHACENLDAFDDAAYYSAIKDGMQVTTSQINPQRYIDYMQPELEKGNDILFIGISSGISGSFASAQMAKEQLEEQYPDRRIELIDSLAASLGEALLVLRAAKCRDHGMTLEETAERITCVRGKLYQVFFVDDLMHLRHTGRLSGGAALIGSVLGIKPLLKGNEQGQIVACGKCRGRKQAIRALAEKYFTLAHTTVKQTIGIAYTNCKEDAEYLMELIREKLPPKEIILAKYEPVTGAHLGPGALALFFEGAAGVRQH